jgi:hypothetical protein
MEQPLILIVDPEASSTVFNEVVDDPSGVGPQQSNEAVAVERGDAAQGRHKDPSGSVLEHGPDAVVGQAVPCSVGRRPSTAPSAEAIGRGDPYGSVSCCKNRGPHVGGQSLFSGSGGDRQPAKSIEPLAGPDPDTSFAVFIEHVDRVAGETVRRCEPIDSPLVHMDQALAGGSDPESAVAVEQQLADGERAVDAGNTIRIELLTGQLPDAVDRRDQQRPVADSDHVGHARHRRGDACRIPRCPPPQARCRSDPERAPVLCQGKHAVAKTFVRCALNRAADRAQACTRNRDGADPYCSERVFEQRTHHRSGEFRVGDQAAVFHAGKSTDRANPEPPVACHQQLAHSQMWQPNRPAGRPRHRLHPVKSKQAGFRSEPQIPVRCLGDRQHAAAEKAVASRPRLMCVLTHVQRRIQRDRGRTPHEQREHRRGDQRRDAAWSIQRCHHRNGITTVIVVPRRGALSKWNVPFS